MSEVKLILGDCLSVMKLMPDKSIDCILTDPPYGIADVWKGGHSKHSTYGWKNMGLMDKVRNSWDKKPDDEVFKEILRIGKTVIIWGGNYFNLPESRGWLVWNKPERGFSLAEAELAWTNLKMPIRVFDCHRSDPNRTHPTQKPLALMNWCIKISKIPKNSTVMDCFMGSGTTGVSCINLGMNFVGIEISEQYFEIAKKRIHDAQQQMRIEFPNEG